LVTSWFIRKVVGSTPVVNVTTSLSLETYHDSGEPWSSTYINFLQQKINQ